MTAVPAPRNEYDRMLNAARLALQDGHPRDFQLSETALRIAAEQGIPEWQARVHFLATANLEHVKRGIHWDPPPELW